MLKENKNDYSNFSFKLNELKNIIKKYGTECFYSKEMIVKTNFGNYNISKKLFNTNTRVRPRLTQVTDNRLYVIITPEAVFLYKHTRAQRQRSFFSILLKSSNI